MSPDALARRHVDSNFQTITNLSSLLPATPGSAAVARVRAPVERCSVALRALVRTRVMEMFEAGFVLCIGAAA